MHRKDTNNIQQRKYVEFWYLATFTCYKVKSDLQLIIKKKKPSTRTKKINKSEKKILIFLKHWIDF